jgi:hypothetical protein
MIRCTWAREALDEQKEGEGEEEEEKKKKEKEAGGWEGERGNRRRQGSVS